MFYSCRRFGLLIIAILCTTLSYATTYTAVSSGNFSSSSTWGGVTPPSNITLDQVIIPSGINVMMDNNITLNGAIAVLTVNGTLSASGSTSINFIMGTVAGAGSITADTLTMGAAATATFTGSLTSNVMNVGLTLATSATVMVNNTLNLTLGTLSFVTGGSLAAANNATIVISGGLLGVGTGGTINLNNAYNVTYASSASTTSGVELSGPGLQNVTVDVGTGNNVTLTSSITINGTLTTTSGSLNLSGYDLTLNGTIAAGGNGTISTSNAASNININTSSGTGGTLSFAGSLNTFNNITVNVGAGNSANISGNLSVAGNLQLTSGTLNFSGSTLTVTGDVTGSGTLAGASNANLSINTAGSLTSALNFAAGSQSVNNLSISVGSGNSASLGSSLTVNGMLTLAAGNTFNINSNTLTIGSGGSISGSGALGTTSSSNIIIDAMGSTTLSTSGTLGNLTIATGSGNVTLANNITISGTLDLQSGTLSLNGNNLNINGNVAASGSGTITSTSASSITINSSTSLAGELGFTAGSNTVGNFTVNIANGGQASLSTDLNITGTLTLTSGTVNVGNYGLIITSSGSIAGGSATSYVITDVNGYLQLAGTAGGSAITFPVGTNLHFAPASVQLSGSASGNVQVGVMGNVLANGTSGADISTTQAVVDATWNVHSDITSNLDMALTVMWSAAMQVNGFDNTSAYISHYTNAHWDNTSLSAATSANGMFSIQRTGITSLSPFAVFNQNTVAAVQSITPDLNFEIYPNPIADNINIQNIAASTAATNMDIYSVTGQLLQSYKLTNTITNVSAANLAPGSYIVKLYNNDTQITKQITKL